MATRHGMSPTNAAFTAVFGARRKKVIKRGLLRAKEMCGLPPFTGLNGLDRALLRHIDFDGGFFVEVGANDGISQSNTYYLERRRAWSGLLIEPIEELAALCRRWRRASVMVAALGRPEDEGREIDLMFGDLTSSVGMPEAIPWNGWFGINPTRVISRIRSLSSILRQAGDPSVDLLSLDVEGAELEALAGLDLTHHRPRYILVETARPQAVARTLGDAYRAIEQLSHHDYLFVRAADLVGKDLPNKQ